MVQVSLWKSPYLGNFMTGQLALAHEVRERLGLATHMVLAEGSETHPWLAALDDAGVTWSVLPAGSRRLRTAALEATAREHRAVLLHSHFTAADLEAASAARRVGGRCVWQLHTGFEGYRWRQRAKDLVKVRLVARRRVDRVIAVAPWIERLALRRGVPADRLVLIPNAISLARFESLPDREQARARLGLPAGAWVALGLAWWPEVKGADLMLEAAARLAAADSSFVLLLVGEDPLREFVAKAIGDPPPWLALSGFVEDPTWLYAAADAFVSASRHEGQSYAIGEAIASGLPVIMSDIEGSAIYRDAPGLRAFEPGDAAALLDVLEAAVNDPLATGRAEEIRAWARAHLAIEPWCERMVALYRDVLA